jgi:hypothetical protein
MVSLTCTLPCDDNYTKTLTHICKIDALQISYKMTEIFNREPGIFIGALLTKATFFPGYDLVGYDAV